MNLRDSARRVMTRLRGSWVALACGAAALVVYVSHGFEGTLTRDPSVYVYAGQSVASGELPYVALFNRAGPLAHVLPGIGVAVADVLDTDVVVTVRILFMLISVTCIGVTFLVARDVFRSGLSGLAAAATMLAVEGFTTAATTGPREKTAMVLFFLIALLAVRHRRWGTAGGFIAIATLTWQPVFFPASTGAVVAILLGAGGGRVRALARVAIGGAVPTAVVLAAYAWDGSVRLFVDHFVLINARYTRQPSASDNPAATWEVLSNGFGWIVWALALGCVALILLAIRVLVARERRVEAGGAATVGAAASLLVGLAWSWSVFDYWPDAFMLLPLAALGIGGIAGLLAQRHRRLAAVATAGWVVATLVTALVFTTTTREHTLEEQRRYTAAVLDQLPTDARIAAVESPQPLVLSGRRNLSRYQLFGNGVEGYFDATWPGGLEGYRQWLLEEQPDVIVVGRRGNSAWLDPIPTEDYQRLPSPGMWVWYVNRDVGTARLHQLEDAMNRFE